MKRYTQTPEIQELADGLREMLDQGIVPLGPDTLPSLRQLNELGFKLQDGDYYVFDLPELAMALDLATRNNDE